VLVNVAHTINIQAGRMLYTTRTILGYAGILSAILDHDMAYVNMTNYISMHGDVLSDHKSVEKMGEEKTYINIENISNGKRVVCAMRYAF